MLKEYFVKYSPDWLFANFYNIFYSKARGKKISRFDSCWLIENKDMKLISPTAKFLSIGMKEFSDKHERYFKIEKGDICVDIGACIGDTTVPMAILTGEKGKVYAVEPDPTNLFYLSLNTDYLETVSIIPKGIWKEKGKAQFSMASAITGHSVMPHKDRNKGISEFEVDTLDNIFVGIHIDFAKIDVQGAETEIFSGGKEFLVRVNKLVIESHYRKENYRTYPFVIDLLKKYYSNVKYCDDNGVIYAWR